MMPDLHPGTPRWEARPWLGTLDFPESFLWGTGSSAYQNEGASSLDGKGESIWDRFTRRPGQIPDGSNGDIACDSYHRYSQDIALMRNAGFRAYRFSIAWSRILPDGVGATNQAGLDYYDRLIEALLQAGIEPFITAYHWDMPQALHERGGWQNRDMIDWLAEYTGLLAKHYGDRVKRWFVLNEPNIHAFMGYLLGENAPGIADQEAYAAANHHQNVATGAALRAMRAQRADLELGSVISLQPTPPATESEDDKTASAFMDAVVNRAYLDPLVKGSYPEVIASLYDGLGLIKPGDLEIASTGLDFLGVNYYSDFFATSGPNGPTVDIRGGPSWLPTTPTGYRITDQGFYKTLATLRDDYANLPVYVSENGMADIVDERGEPTLEDHQRVEYFARHLYQLGRAIGDGCNVKGYFAWTLVDNFEWEWGYQQRYGLVALDRASLARTPKASYRFLAEVVQANALNFEKLGELAARDGT